MNIQMETDSGGKDKTAKKIITHIQKLIKRQIDKMIDKKIR